MMKFPFSARILCGGVVCLLSACASTSGSTADTEPRKVAAANCEVEEPRIGSNMTHRSCTPAAFVPTAAATPAAPSNAGSAQ